MPRLLVIDDRDTTVEMCHRHLANFDYVSRCDRNIPCQVCEERDRGCPLKCAHDYREAEETLSREGALPDLVVLDLHFALPEARLLPEDKSHLPVEPAPRKRAIEELRRRQGLLILERLRQAWPTLPVVMLTTTDAELKRGGDGAGAPWGSTRDPLVYLCENEIVDSRTLAAEVSRALELHHAAQEGAVFWGQTSAMAELRRALGTLSRSPLPVLLEGETGTGKSFLAEHVIHPRSGVKGPLVVTDLSTVPPALLPAHLFGTRRGSYTGSVDDSAGVFEQAHGGTLFLDEIANLDLDLQRQLLLVLERRSVTRLGDARSRPAVVKLVAATNQDLEALVRAGRFRADLFMRLNPATRLLVPPLRERREDLPELIRFALLEALGSESLRPLARSFLARFPTPDGFREASSTVVFGKPSLKQARPDGFSVFLSRTALGELVAHPWPGNLRELKMLAMNAVVFTLVEQLENAGTPVGDADDRAPAVLAVSDRLIGRLLGRAPMAAGGKRKPAAESRGGPVSDGEGGQRMDVVVRPGNSFAQVSAEVEKQYLSAIYHAANGDLDVMGQALLGKAGAARKVHLRLNQVGLRLRELRGEK